MSEDNSHLQAELSVVKASYDVALKERDYERHRCEAYRKEIELLKEAVTRLLLWEPRSTDAAWEQDYEFAISLLKETEMYALVANGSPSPFESADRRGTLHAAELRAEHWKKKAESLEWQIENLGCASSRKGETTYECNAERPCGLCRMRSALESVKDACDPECAGCGAYFIADKALRSAQLERSWTDDLEQFIVDRDSESPGFSEKVKSAEDAALERERRGET